MKVSLSDALLEILNRFRWRWECLRQNDEYRRDYSIVSSRFGVWFENTFDIPLSGVFGITRFHELCASRMVSWDEWKQADYVALAQFVAFQQASAMKWGCLWLCTPHYDLSSVKFSIPSSSSTQEVFRHFAQFPLVLSRTQPFDLSINISEAAQNFKASGEDLVESLKQIPLLCQWLETNLETFFTLPLVQDFNLPNGWSIPSTWSPAARLIAQAAEDGTLSIKPHPMSDPQTVIDLYVDFCLYLSLDILSIELARYSLPKSFETSPFVFFSREDVEDLNCKRGRFPLGYIADAMKCFRLKNEQSQTDAKISETLSESRGADQMIDVSRIKRYRKTVRRLVAEGCPW